MEFPYIFTGSYASKLGQIHLIPCTIQIYAIHLQIVDSHQQQVYTGQVNVDKNIDTIIYKYTHLKFDHSDENRMNIVKLMHKNQLIILSINNSSEFLIFSKILQFLIPKNDLKQHFRVYSIFEELTNQQFFILTGKNVTTKFNHLIRSFKLDNPAVEQQLQIIFALTHRCFSKPICSYIDNPTNSLKLIYKYFRGIYLSEIYKLKKVYTQQQLRQFARKILFSFEELENKKISYYKIQQNIILKNLKLINPIIINFSPAKLNPKENSQNITQLYKKILGQIIYKLIFHKKPEKIDIQALKKLLKYNNTKRQIAFFFRQYSILFLQFLIEMLSDQNINIPLIQYTKHRWLIYKIYRHHTSKLQTINSIQSEQNSNNTIQELLDIEDVQSVKDIIFEQYEGICSIEHKMKNYNLEYVIHR